MAAISGNSELFLVLNYLFKSFPDAPVREFPKITPSGLIIGTITIISLDKSKTTFLANISSIG